MTILFPIRDSENTLTKTAPDLAEEVKPGLLRAFQKGGDLPVSAGVLRNLRVLLGERNPNVSKVAKAICADPLLTLRIVSLVNFPAYSRGRPVLTVTNAINQMGFVQIVKLIEEFAGEKDFQAIFLGRGSSAVLLSRIVASALMSQKLVELLAPRRGLYEQALVACMLINMPEFLLSFYKPNIYTAIAIECRRSGADFDKGFKRVFKQSAADFVDELINSLSLPKEYISMTRALASPPWNRRWNPDDRDDTKAVVKGVYLANQLALKVFSFCNDEDGRAFVRELGAKSEDFATDDLFDTLEEIGSQLRESLDLIGVPQVRLPKFDIRNKPKGAEPDESPPPPAAPANISARLNPFLVELKVTLKSKVSEGEPGRIFQAAHCTLSALVHTLNFDRAYLMGDDGAGVMRLLLYYGPASPSGEAYVRKLDTKGREFLPDLLAHFERKTVFTGDPLFGDDWPFVCFPVVAAGKSLGVIYADRVADEKAQALSLEEQLAVTALAEQWQSIPSEFR